MYLWEHALIGKKGQTGREKWVCLSSSDPRSALYGARVEAFGPGLLTGTFPSVVQAGGGEQALRFVSRHFGRHLPIQGRRDLIVLIPTFGLSMCRRMADSAKPRRWLSHIDS